MKINPLLQELHNQDILSQPQLDQLAANLSGRRFSVHHELRTLLYVGVLLIATGISLTIKKYFADLGHLAILMILTCGCLGSWTYCFLNSEGYTSGASKSPGMAAAYLLVLGCLLYSLEVAYLETHFHILDQIWETHFLISAGLFFFLAYRFDNRMVLSLALSSLAAWFGFTVKNLDFLAGERILRSSALVYGVIVLAVGILLHRRSIKKHFLQIYLNFAAHFIFVALLSGLSQNHMKEFYKIALLAAVLATGIYAIRSKQFVYMLYAVLYGYIGLSILVVKHIHATGSLFFYFIFSSVAVVISVFVMSRRFKVAP